MRKLIIGFIFLTLAYNAQAQQQIKVKQVKGNKAIVEFPANEALNSGETYYLMSQPTTTPSGSASRDYLIGMNFQFYSIKSDVTNSQTQSYLYVDGKFGWNMKQYEFGPLVTFINDKTTTNLEVNTSTFGGFATWNFMPNVSGQTFILSADGTLTIGSSKSTTGSLSTTTNTTIGTIGGFAKWFGLSEHFCLRGGGVYKYKKDSATTDVTSSGFEVVAGISTYF